MRPSLPILGFVCALSLSVVANAADFTLRLKTAGGQPVRDAVVTVYPVGAAAAGAYKPEGPLRIVQHDIEFEPFVTVVPTG